MSHTPLARVAMAREPTWIVGMALVICVPPLGQSLAALVGGCCSSGIPLMAFYALSPLQERCSLATQRDHQDPRALLRCSRGAWWRTWQHGAAGGRGPGALSSCA